MRESRAAGNHSGTIHVKWQHGAIGDVSADATSSDANASKRDATRVIGRGGAKRKTTGDILRNFHAEAMSRSAARNSRAAGRLA